jgi:hypothetical protein
MTPGPPMVQLWSDPAQPQETTVPTSNRYPAHLVVPTVILPVPLSCEPRIHLCINSIRSKFHGHGHPIGSALVRPTNEQHRSVRDLLAYCGAQGLHSYHRGKHIRCRERERPKLHNRMWDEQLFNGPPRIYGTSYCQLVLPLAILPSRNILPPL